MAAGIATNLTPTTVSSDDYAIAQAPSQGMEKQVYLTLRPSTFLGVASMTSTGVVSYEFQNTQRYLNLTGTVSITTGQKTVAGTDTLFTTEVKVGDIVAINNTGTTYQYGQVDSIASDTELTVFVNWSVTTASPVSGKCYSGDPICAFVLSECRAGAAPVATFNDLAGTFTPAGYASDTTYNFGTTRGVELVSASEVNSPILAASVPTITNMYRGCRVGFIQLPRLTDFKLVGSTKTSDITVPSRSSKAIARGTDSSWWSKPGMTTEGRLRVTALDLIEDDGLSRYRGSKCQAMVVTKKEDTVITSRQFCTNINLGGETRNPEGDETSELSAEGSFQYMVTLVAP
jgi:hypothetical protein